MLCRVRLPCRRRLSRSWAAKRISTSRTSAGTRAPCTPCGSGAWYRQARDLMAGRSTRSWRLTTAARVFESIVNERKDESRFAGSIMHLPQARIRRASAADFRAGPSVHKENDRCDLNSPGLADGHYLSAGRTERYRTVNTVQRTRDDMDESVMTLDKGTGKVHLQASRLDADVAHMENAMLQTLRAAGPAYDASGLARGLRGTPTTEAGGPTRTRGCGNHNPL